jgi:hypothetical protein
VYLLEGKHDQVVDGGYYQVVPMERPLRRIFDPVESG